MFYQKLFKCMWFFFSLDKAKVDHKADDPGKVWKGQKAAWAEEVWEKGLFVCAFLSQNFEHTFFSLTRETMWNLIGCQVQTEVIQKRHKEKKAMMSAVKKYQKGVIFASVIFF